MKLASAAWMEWPATQALLRAFAEGGVPLRFVGGCVRDSLLGREVKDVDAATPATPDRVSALLQAAGIRAIPTGIAHGTVTALVGERLFEITTLRRDVACDGRHAEVAFTDDWREDAARRDFTINALYAGPDGEVVDYFGGLAHLAPLKLVFIGDASARIREDALRMLRFFRFTAQLGVQGFDAAGLAACAREAARIQNLSGERIAQEMLKLLGCAALEPEVLHQLHAAGLTAPLLLPAPPPALARLHGVTDAFVRLALWAPEGIEAITERWRLSREQHAHLLALVATMRKLSPALPPAEQKKLLRAAGNYTFTRAVQMAAARDDAAYDAMLHLANSWQPPAFPVTGKDLLAHGYAEGKGLGEALKRLEAQWEAEDYLPTRAALLARATPEGAA